MKHRIFPETNSNKKRKKGDCSSLDRHEGCLKESLSFSACLQCPRIGSQSTSYLLDVFLSLKLLVVVNELVPSQLPRTMVDE
jgi:hypothetical protein